MFVRQFCRLSMVVFCIYAWTGTAAAATDDRRAVEETFLAAQTALADHDAVGVLDALSSATRQKLETIRQAATTRQPAGLPPAEKFAAMGLRRFVPREELAHMDSADLIRYALDKAWLGPRIIRESGLRNVVVTGDRAEGTLLIRGKPQLFPADFVREHGAWKVDLTRVLKISDQLLRLRIGSSGRGGDTVIAALLDQLAHRQGQPHP